ncbi:hypothetical protein [Salsipaludibacter albus]|uniref:hypothetical protein n=1 Tax=Salsipaludibacter albus TaxID=2849650 RepID=UPI001EE3B2AC|nr:hypothetical protein [Salsipaludibacter albus]MBY5163000.1 hypothetical protein [Salsipaludibacter albus]
MSDELRPARRDFRVHTQQRGGYEGAVMHDVQLVLSSTGAIIWAQTFTDADQAAEFLEQLTGDLDTMDTETFRDRYSVPSSM